MTAAPNPLLTDRGFPAFDQIRPEHVEPAVAALLERCSQILNRLELSNDRGWGSLMEPMEQIDLLFEYGWSPIGHLLAVANSEALRAVHEAVLPAVTEFGLRLRQSDSIYRRLCDLRDSEEWSGFCNAQRRIVTRSIENAEFSGIGLPGTERERFNQIEQELSRLGTDFANHVLDSTRAFHLDLTGRDDVAGLTPSLLRLTSAAWSRAPENTDKPAATPDDGPWRITLDLPCFGPFMEHCCSRRLRETVYRAYISRASVGSSDNSELISRILTLRKEQAALLKFRSFAEQSLSRKMAESPQAVRSMFEQLLGASFETAKQELEDIRELARQHEPGLELAHWDVAFWAERLREQKFSFTDEQLRPYFSLDRVLAGLFGLCQRLFGITVVAADGDAPVWHQDVRYFEIHNEQDHHIAGFYLDPYSRPADKRGGAWMSDCIARSVTANGIRLPVAHLVCNGTPPVGDVPSLMTFREVETLFHEFGHGLQHMLTAVDFRDAAGISGVEWDAVELPSQFMENWCYHRPTLLGMALHFQTGEPLPDDLYRKLCEARTFRAASQMLRQLQLGMADMALHTEYDPGGSESPFELEQRIVRQTSLLPPLPENRFLCSFQHIFTGGYAAGYYSYKWAEVLSADAFAAFEEVGLDNDDEVAATGRRFRDTILAQGGSRHPMQIFEDFRGRQPTTAALLRHYGLGEGNSS